MDFQGLGSFWKVVFVVVCWFGLLGFFPPLFFFKLICIYLSISSELLASPPSPPLFSTSLEATSQKRMIVNCATVSCLNLLLSILQFN